MKWNSEAPINPAGKQKPTPVVYRGRPSRRAGPDGGEARWDVLEFLARVVDHIPEPSHAPPETFEFVAESA